MSASAILSFAALAFGCVACLFIGLFVLYYAIFYRRFNKQLQEDRGNEYKLPVEAMPQSRPCPRWMSRATGRATR